MNLKKKFICICADDFGITHNVNKSILELAKKKSQLQVV